MTLQTTTLPIPTSLPEMLGQMARGQTVQVIAASPDAPVAREILEALPALAARGIRLEAIFAQAGRSPLTRLAADHGSRMPVRVVNIPDQGEISEQVNFGDIAVWTGRKLKGREGAAFGEGQLKAAGEGSDKAQMARMAFRALWAVSAASMAISEPANDAAPVPGLKVASSR